MLKHWWCLNTGLYGRCYAAAESIDHHPVMATGPSLCPPTILFLHLLTAGIIWSSDCLFFVSHSIGSNEAHEWWLVQVAFEDSMLIYPSCTQDGKVLFEFYICHPSDWHYNVINQRFCLQSHNMSNIMSSHSAMETNLICLPNSSTSYAAHHKLVPFRKWLTILHLDTYIHRPFLSLPQFVGASPMTA